MTSIDDLFKVYMVVLGNVTAINSGIEAYCCEPKTEVRRSQRSKYALYLSLPTVFY